MASTKSTPSEPLPVLVIGAGESGIALGAQLRSKLGLPASAIRIYERHSGIGGTWHINRYPGVACDVPAIFYSFSFALNPKWTSFYPEGKEIVTYLKKVADDFGVTDSIQCDVDVAGCTWDDQERLWHVKLRHLKSDMGDLSDKERKKVIAEKGEDAVVMKEEIVKAEVVCSCVGGLVEPRGWPDEIKGIENFRGKMFHSARWDYNVDLKDKNVVVVGTGCSAAQFVPRLTKEYGAKSVTQIMRSPPWVVPRMSPPGGEEGWSTWAPWLLSRVPGLNRLLRALIFLGSEQDWVLFGGEEKADKARAKLEDILLRHMKRTVPKEYHEILTPDYSVGCKRRIFDALWFQSLNDPEIELTTLPLTSVQQNSVTLGPGRTYPDPKKTDSLVSQEARNVEADVLILANGFDTTTWLHPLAVTGRGGVDLVSEMHERGGPQAYQGTSLDGFPNFFIIFGPNTATGHSSVILATENMIAFALPFIKLILNGEASEIEVKKDAEIEYTRDLQEALSKTVWMSGGCQSWYFTADGWISTMYPYSQWYFTWRCMFPKWQDWSIAYTRKGRRLQMLRIAVKVIASAAVIIVGFRARRTGVTLSRLWSEPRITIRDFRGR